MRTRLLGLVFGFTAAVVASGALAAQPETAWEKAGAPVQATGAFVPPPPGTEEAFASLKSYALYGEDNSGGGILNEIRLGVLGFWQNNASTEQGVYVAGHVFFDPLLGPFDNRFLNILLRPRPHIGASGSLDGTDQLFAGLTWNVPLWRSFFLEGSFGGTIHNGPLSGAQVSLGCRVLFRESLSLGMDVGEHWRVLAGVDHSSHADLCDGENDGLSHLGVALGYRF